MIAYSILNVVIAAAFTADITYLTDKKKRTFWILFPFILLISWPRTILYPVLIYSATLLWIWQAINIHRKLTWRSAAICFALALGITAFGMWKFDQRTKTEYTVMSKDNTTAKIVFLSDMHYPNGMDDEELDELIGELAAEKPDMYLLGGDIVDESSSSEDMGEVFSKLKSLETTAPVFYIYGNHDSKDGAEKLEDALDQSGLEVLADESVQVGDVTVIGRDDRSHNKERKEVVDLNVPDTFSILVDHQPVEADEVSAAGADLMLSGHTHNGQLWPFGEFINFTPKYDQVAGKWWVGDMVEITSSGIAGWGFPVRTSDDSEYVVVNIVPLKR